MEKRNFVEEFKRRIARIDQTPEVTIPIVKEIPQEIQVPAGPVYSVFKRSPKGCNKRVLMNLPKQEALKSALTLNKKEQEKRAQGITQEDPIFFDFVQDHTEEENLYWNPKNVVKEEGTDPSIEIIKGTDNYTDNWM